MITLAATLRDPTGAMLEQTARVRDVLADRFSAIAVVQSPDTAGDFASIVAGVPTRIVVDPDGDVGTVGVRRREALQLALETQPAAILHCDWDRILHWAEYWPEELAAVCDRLPDADLTILGRTPRAFASHPAPQRDTEAMINHVFGLCYGEALDVTAAARGISPAAARWLIAHDDEPTFGVDCGWPLLLRHAGFRVVFHATEGLEFETADRFGDAIAAIGGRAAWLDRLDRNPDEWAYRVRMAQHETAAAVRAWRRTQRVASADENAPTSS